MSCILKRLHTHQRLQIRENGWTAAVTSMFIVKISKISSEKYLILDSPLIQTRSMICSHRLNPGCLETSTGILNEFLHELGKRLEDFLSLAHAKPPSKPSLGELDVNRNLQHRHCIGELRSVISSQTASPDPTAASMTVFALSGSSAGFPVRIGSRHQACHTSYLATPTYYEADVSRESFLDSGNCFSASHYFNKGYGLAVRRAEVSGIQTSD
jgi:hypothetical protein